MQDKICNRCDISKPTDDFSPDPKGTFGRRADCKPCRNERSAELKARRKLGIVDLSKRAPITKYKRKSPKPVVIETEAKEAITAEEAVEETKLIAAEEKNVHVNADLFKEPDPGIITEIKNYKDIDVEIERRVEERLQEQSRQRKERQEQRTREQRAEIRAMKMLMENHAEEFKRIFDRELVRVETRKIGYAS